MSAWTILLATTLGWSARQAPAQHVAAALAALPPDVRVTGLVWDGRRVWMSGDGPVPLTTDGTTRTPEWAGTDPALRQPALVAAGTVSTVEVLRRPVFVSGGPHADHQGPSGAVGPFEQVGVWVGAPRYHGDDVSLDVVAKNSRTAERAWRALQWSPCLADARRVPVPNDEAVIAFTVEARGVGDLTDAACQPALPAPTESRRRTTEVRGDWPTVWQALQAADGGPVVGARIVADDAGLVLELDHFIDGRFEVGPQGTATPRLATRRDRKAVSVPGAPASDSLRAVAEAVFVAAAVHSAPDAPLSLGGPATASDVARLDGGGNPLHVALARLDTPLADLRDVRLEGVEAVDDARVEVSLTVEQAGLPAALDLLAEEVASVGVQLLVGDSGPSLDGGLQGVRRTSQLTVSVPMPTDGPRAFGRPGADRGGTVPADPFTPTEGWAVGAGAGTTDLIFEPLIPYKTWHLSYLGTVGLPRPVGLVQEPSGRVVQVMPGARVGDDGGRVVGLGSDGLTLERPSTTASGSEQGARLLLPSAPHPPDEALLPATHIRQVDPAAWDRMRALFPDGNRINIDVAGADLLVLMDLFAKEGVPVLPEPGLEELPPVSLYARDRSVGDLVADVQLVLLQHDLVFDETLILVRDPVRARALATALRQPDKVALHTLDVLARSPTAAPLHITGVQPFDLLRLMSVPTMLAAPPVPPVSISAPQLSAPDLVAALQAQLEAVGQEFWWVGDHLVVVASSPTAPSGTRSP